MHIRNRFDILPACYLCRLRLYSPHKGHGSKPNHQYLHSICAPAVIFLSNRMVTYSALRKLHAQPALPGPPQINCLPHDLGDVFGSGFCQFFQRFLFVIIDAQ
jgi:hypothetical protein